MTTTQPNSEPQWLREIADRQEVRELFTTHEASMFTDIDKLIAEYKAMREQRDAAYDHLHSVHYCNCDFNSPQEK